MADVAFIHHDDAVLHTVSKLIAPSDPLFRTPTAADERSSQQPKPPWRFPNHGHFAPVGEQPNVVLGGPPGFGL